MDTLRPVEVSEYYINRVASGMSKYFWDNIFKEIFDILKDNTVSNSKDDVINALRIGRIWYEKGAFRGKFNNAISTTLEQLGAKFRNGAYYISKTSIPFEYVTVIDFVAAQGVAKANRISDFLAGLGSILSGISLKSYIEATVDLMYRKLQLDIVKSAQEKKVPVIELGIVQPSVTFPKTKKERLKRESEQLGLDLGDKPSKGDTDQGGNPPNDETDTGNKPPKPNKDGSNIPKDENGPKEEPKKDEQKSQGYSLEEIYF